MKNIECAYTAHNWGYFLRCVHILFPSYIKIFLINHIFNGIHKTSICSPISELPIKMHDEAK